MLPTSRRRSMFEVVVTLRAGPEQATLPPPADVQRYP